ncbi:Global transcription regulator sge1, partial [Basidiobolus ranarum]
LRSGSVYVFDEKESGIKRWTDGRLWSPSRILGNFLVYRELDKKIAPRKPGSNRVDEETELQDIDKSSVLESNKGTFVFKHGGLIKKTIAIELNNTCQHLICYHTVEDVHIGLLHPPHAFMELAEIKLSSDLLKQHRFRKPIKGYGRASESPDGSENQSISTETVGEYQSLTDVYDEASNWNLDPPTDQVHNENGNCNWNGYPSNNLNWSCHQSLSLPQLHALFPNLQFNDHSEFSELYSAHYPTSHGAYIEANPTSSTQGNDRKRKSR